jgi:hypothetical protein
MTSPATSLWGGVWRRIRRIWHSVDEVARDKAVETIEYEVGELDNIFALLVLGSFVGIPAPPAQITLELLPEMESEMETMLDKVTTAHDPLGELFSVLDID